MIHILADLRKSPFDHARNIPDQHAANKLKMYANHTETNQRCEAEVETPSDEGAILMEDHIKTLTKHTDYS